ncbi:MAG: aminopeptidase P N-terminal domain-containing protein, partial [Gemmatimonadales bacterium]
MRARRLRIMGLFLLSALMQGTQVVSAQAGSPAGPIPVKVLAARRSALLDSLGTGVAVLRSAGAMSIEGDYPQASDFRQDNDFFYLTGLETPDSWLVFVAREDTVDETILFIPPRNPSQERWTGPKPGPDSLVAARTGITDIRPADDVESDIRQLLFSRSSPARTGGVYLKLDEDAGTDSYIRGLVFGRPAGDIHDLRVQLAQLRVVKDAEGMRRLEKAIELTDEAQLAAMRVARPGIHEYELEAEIEATFRRGGAERVGFPSIVGSGINSTVLHYDKNRRQTEDGDLVVMDIGAEFGYYSADITRTIPVSGRFTDRQKEVYELVLATQQAAIDSVRPGTTVRDLNRVARDY